MYQALYRQYRPKSFDELLGQNHVTTILKNQIQKENIGHAYLFSGTRGTGKTSAAKIFSRAVNCLNPIDGNPCNECENCKGILEETIMDVIEMDAASHNSVEDVRDLREKVVYPPSKAKYKVYIVDEVHMLTKSAFNALLKTLEEPPKHLIFVLATTEPERLPQTILSRCQRFDFKRITNKDMVLNMQNILENRDIEVDDEVLNLIARNSDGAMRDALSLLDKCISFSEDKIDYEDAISILGMVNKDLIFEFINDIKDKNLEKSLMSIDEIIQNGKDIHQFIKDIIVHFRNLMVVKSSNNPNNILDIDDVDDYMSQSKTMDMDYILKALEIFTLAESQAKWSTQPRILLEMATIKLVNADDELTLLERIERLESGLGPIKGTVKPNIIVTTETRQSEKPMERKSTFSNTTKDDPIKGNTPKVDKPKENAPKPAIIDDGKELHLETIKEQWPNVLQQIKSSKISLYALIIEGEVLSFENDLLTIAFREGFGFHYQAVSKNDNREFVEQIVSTYFNKNINVRFIMGVNKSQPKESKNDENKDEAIKGVIDLFGEDIVEIK
ncbi:MAG: DNA polymerase III subunit gamma/tau [Tissierellaceae bacterium]|nr:DNA polymerase III subunit gamma/tau [Tissierellaceae bacterium]